MTTKQYLDCQGWTLKSRDTEFTVMAQQMKHLFPLSTLARAQQIFDSYLSVEREVLRNLRAVTFSSIILATKWESSARHLRPCDFPLWSSVLVLFELKIVQALDFRLGASYSTWEWMHKLVECCVEPNDKAIFYDEKSEKRHHQHRSQRRRRRQRVPAVLLRPSLFFSYLQCYELLSFSPLTVAQSMILLLLPPSQHVKFHQRLGTCMDSQDALRVSVSQVEQCLVILQQEDEKKEKKEKREKKEKKEKEKKEKDEKKERKDRAESFTTPRKDSSRNGKWTTQTPETETSSHRSSRQEERKQQQKGDARTKIKKGSVKTFDDACGKPRPLFLV